LNVGALRPTAFALAVLASPAVAQPARFDLICTGTDASAAKTIPDNRRYTIDLTAKRWCRTSECEQGVPIERVTADEITLRRNDQRSSAYHHVHYISRTKGTYTERLEGAGAASSTATGTCKPAPFSGFPKAKF
jgi:hypothetical protein